MANNPNAHDRDKALEAGRKAALDGWPVRRGFELNKGPGTAAILRHQWFTGWFNAVADMAPSDNAFFRLDEGGRWKNLHERVKKLEQVKLALVAAAASLLALTAVSTCRAATIGPPADPSEQRIGQILTAEYGPGGFTRLSDDDDRLWPEPVGFRILGSQAAASQDFGWFLDPAGSGLYVLRDFAFLPGAPWVGSVFSLPSLNPDGRDHMISFMIDAVTFAVGFEDWFFGFPDRPTDHDFNDLVVEVSFAPPPASVPEPAYGTLVGMLIIGLCLWKVRRGAVK